ncbi:acyl-CoA dehydrogenase family protein [Lutimaribacter sp. EGI FJ00015]|uniref:Acyl-CoA dehydrogenase family protein n=1 Tax=Lutimaribacter degradans TaxID=2945989 RepID=A0ACC5ZVD2_9RHOB|nr:acyl-CoA dehydrogenase family protein [Lutimaribacter sp. EGI FJ00013]MCM2561800.1 acyl-CoA dehydrogenase family protein [Lutimaribacter sp. EGI FJ00013]MCO0613167.1 acyl-CoA dehydrogenase family protein [Lutimaribacter sp. EGI FJ00015]MCO0635633.1 acyl-CoA dehydrogenase family protein [Lutimaribacter sp. EGI FJ00014]
MDFNLTEDRQMLSDSLNRFLADKYPVEHRNKVAYDLPCHDPDKWADMAELGALFALAPEDAGGFGGSGFDISVVFEALGRALCPEPVLGATMAARILTKLGADQDALLSGATKYAVALAEVDAPYDPAGMDCEAKPEGEGHALSGRKTSVYGGQVADIFLVAAMLNGTPALFEVQAGDAQVVGYPMMDGGGAAELLLDATKARLLSEDAAAIIQDAVNAGIVALCAEAVGAMDVTHATTVDYLKQRKQFGVPIGKFQVLQHRAVDMLTEIEQSRSITIKAAAELDGPDAARFASMAKNMIGRAARLVAEEAIQMHGGIAMTWEYPVSHYAKRLVMLDAQLGDTDYHLSRIMDDLAA